MKKLLFLLLMANFVFAQYSTNETSFQVTIIPVAQPIPFHVEKLKTDSVNISFNFLGETGQITDWSAAVGDSIQITFPNTPEIWSGSDAHLRFTLANNPAFAEGQMYQAKVRSLRSPYQSPYSASSVYFLLVAPVVLPRTPGNLSGQ